MILGACDLKRSSLMLNVLNESKLIFSESPSDVKKTNNICLFDSRLIYIYIYIYTKHIYWTEKW